MHPLSWPKQHHYRPQGSARQKFREETGKMILQELLEQELKKQYEESLLDPTILNKGRLLHLKRYDWYETSIEEEEFIERIQNNYEQAISRTSDYIGDLEGHILRGYGIVYQPDPENKSVLVGFTLRDIFIVSHFAPTSLKKGAELIQNAAKEKMPIVIACPAYQSSQLERSGFKYLTQVPQIFNGEIISKNVMINDAVNLEDIQYLKAFYEEELEKLYNRDQNDDEDLK